MTINYVPALISVIALSACGGSDDSTPSFANLLSRGAALETAHGGATPTPLGSMPTGTATYNGIAAFSEPGLPFNVAAIDSASEIQLVADFGTATIEGSLTNFRDLDNNAIGGTVLIDPGSIAGNSYVSTLSGALDVAGTSLGVSGTIDGAFVGAGAEAILGTISADVTGIGTLSGEYVAEQ